MEEHRPAGKRERVDLFQIDDVERIAELRLFQIVGNLGHEPLANVLDERVGGLIVEERQLLAHLGSRLATELHILFGRVAVLVRFDPRLCAHGEREGRDNRSNERRCSCSPRVGGSDEWSSHAH
jgi:hypothetical protein